MSTDQPDPQELSAQVAELERVNRALQRKLDELAIVFAEGRDLHVLVDLSRQIVQVSDNLPVVLGYRPEDLVGRPYSVLLADDEDASKFLAEGPPLVQDGIVLEQPIRHHRGDLVWMDMRISFVATPGHEHLMLINLRDASQRRQEKRDLEHRLLHLERLVDTAQRFSRLMPICAWCKRVRRDEDYWQQVESFLLERTGMYFTHSICPDCANKIDAPSS